MLGITRPPCPTVQELDEAHRRFLENDPRDLFYRTATELVGLAQRDESGLTLAETLAAILQMWNHSLYFYNPGLRAPHLSGIETLLGKHCEPLAALRTRSIESEVTEADQALITGVFLRFDQVLGPVGAAKALHLLAPRLLPLWDRAIAAGYGCRLAERGLNGDRYLRFLLIAREQCLCIGGERGLGRNPLKALDEYNYCKFTKGWF